MKKEIKKKYFITGIVLLVPLWITLYIIWLFLKLISNISTPFIITFFYAFQIPENKFLIFIFSFIISLLIIYFIGFLANTVIGKNLLKSLEEYFYKIPIIKEIYPSVKKLIYFFTEQNKLKNNQVVIVEYPRKGCYTIGIITLKTETKVGVFIPSTPNPTTGYLIFISEEEVKPINLSIEEALKIIISGGISVDNFERDKLNKI
ncbi:MAG: DUF502 domain-containing protein [Elusimicrobiota bacterium]|nr:DUF502 domain-containing protein [Endomicrobiia bacterium]MDW8165311.1 DUF502 domain-containing protein [Elusimicrobiota bacterium]